MSASRNARRKTRSGRYVLGVAIGLVALGAGSLPAAATDPIAPEEGITEWTSKDAGESGGRELPSVSADGRWVAFVGRGEGQGVWLADRTANTVQRLTTGSHFNPAVSDDGRFIAYVVYGDPREVRVLEVATGASKLVSLGDDGNPADGLSDFPTISADGRYVAFQSTDATLDDDVTQPGPGGGPNRAYVRDLLLNETEMVGVTDGNEASQGSAIKPDISPDGRYVAFAAEAANLLPPAPVATAADEEEPAAAQQIYLRDRTAGTTTLVSVDPTGQPGDAISAIDFGPTVSDDGGRVAFESLAANLVAGDTNADVDAFARDLGAGTTTRLSVDLAGNEVDLPNPVVDPPGAETSETTEIADPVVGGAAVISGDGNVVAFQSQAPLTADDENGTVDNWVKDVYARDLAADTFERVSLPNPGGTEASGTRTEGSTGAIVPQTNGADPSIDAHGRYVAFISNGNLTGDRPVGEEEVTTSEDVSTESGIFTRLRLGDEGWYIKSAYVDLLDRDVDSGGLVYWVERLWRTGDRNAVTGALTSSSEYRRTLVRAAYLTYLERDADPAGLSYWMGKLASGTPVETMEANLLGSNEAFNLAGATNAGFVEDAFQKVLERPADPSGLAYWTAKLDAGTTRTGMAITLIRSGESARLRVEAIYQQLLDRSADPQGLTYWSTKLTSGTSRVTVIRSIIASDEYFFGAEDHLAG